MPADPRPLLAPLRRVHDAIRDAVVAATEAAAHEHLASVAGDEAGDTIYAVDRVSEAALLEAFERELAPAHPLMLIAEGIEGGYVVLPRGMPEADARWRVIVDPIDGTRGLMYQKRSGWVLTGVAPNRGPETCLADIVLAVQTEIPLVRQHLSDQLWAVAGDGAAAERIDRIAGTRRPVTLRPSGAETLAHGFASVSRFFPGARAELAAIDEEIVEGALGPIRPGRALLFEDQYIASGGQLYELMAGRDRFIADLRPLTEPLLARRGLALGISAHPYDLCTELIARALGVHVVTPAGGPLRAPLDVDTPVAWAGYANATIRATVEPLLQAALRRRDLL